MISFTSAIMAIITAMYLLQMCPAPVVGAVVRGAGPAIRATKGVAKAVEGASQVGNAAQKNHRHEPRLFTRNLPAGAPRYAMELCVGQIKDQKAKQGRFVNISDIDATSALLVENVLPACMTLATVLLAKSAQEGGAFPIPMGTDSLKYMNVSADDRNILAEALSAGA